MTIALYLSRQVGFRILAVVLGFLALALGLDLLENSTEIIDRYGTAAVGIYAALRAPLMLVTILPICVLIGAVLAFAALALKSEMVILRAAGFNTLRMVLRLLPVALALGLFHSYLTGTIAPAAESELGRRFPQMFETPASVKNIWLRDMTGVIRIGELRDSGDQLVGVSIFETNATGALLRRIDAAEARPADGGWQLSGVTLQAWNEPKQAMDTMLWETRITARGVLSAAWRPDLIDTSEIRQVLEGKLPRGRGTPFYTVKLWRSYAAYVVPLVMILFGSLASFGLSRSGGFARKVALGFAGGMGFIVFDGVTSSLGQAGAMGAVPAAFLAPGLFLVAGVWSIVLAEE